MTPQQSFREIISNYDTLRYSFYKTSHREIIHRHRYNIFLKKYEKYDHAEFYEFDFAFFTLNPSTHENRLLALIRILYTGLLYDAGTKF